MMLCEFLPLVVLATLCTYPTPGHALVPPVPPCDYVDLCTVSQHCGPGHRFLLPSRGKGLRRQFLVTKASNILLFLANDRKVGDCGGNFRDVTPSVACKVRISVRGNKSFNLRLSF